MEITFSWRHKEAETIAGSWRRTCMTPETSGSSGTPPPANPQAPTMAASAGDERRCIFHLCVLPETGEHRSWRNPLAAPTISIQPIRWRRFASWIASRRASACRRTPDPPPRRRCRTSGRSEQKTTLCWEQKVRTKIKKKKKQPGEKRKFA